LKISHRKWHAGQVESLQSSLHTANGRANQLQRANELLETQLKNLKLLVVDAERRQAADAARHQSAGQDVDRQRQLHEISELKQQVYAS